MNTNSNKRGSEILPHAESDKMKKAKASSSSPPADSAAPSPTAGARNNRHNNNHSNSANFPPAAATNIDYAQKWEEEVWKCRVELRDKRIIELEGELDWTKELLDIKSAEMEEKEKREVEANERKMEEKVEDGTRAERVEALMDKKKRLLKELKVKVREVELEVEIIEAEYSQYFPSFHRGPEDNADEVPPPNKWNAYNN